MKDMTRKEEFISILMATGRKGMDNVIRNLEELGFFEAPASTIFHLNEEGGLVEHSLNVYREAMLLRTAQISLRPGIEEMLPEDSIAIAALLHDVCKADIYRKCRKKRRNAEGIWENCDAYEVDYSVFPLGHGEKSAIRLLQWGLEMTDDEIMAIRWHMEAWDLPFQSADLKANLNTAKSKSPLLSLVKAADGLAASILERKP